ncbi:MAG: phosphatidate cytidylyltransferase [Actinomycetota bacterium]|nr:phosphatidate cytidylyltransferase [Actinomycetota bacterium]
MSEPRANERPGRNEAGAPRPEPEPEGRAPEAADAPEAPERGPSTEQLRITAVQAAVAAGLVPSTGRRPSEDEEEAPPAPPALPDWTDPPTGQIPRVLIDREHLDEDGQEIERQMRGPTWREAASDWDDDADLGLSFLLEDEGEDEPSPKIAGREDTATDLEELYADLDAIAPPAGRPAPASAPPAFARVDEPAAATSEPALAPDPPAAAPAEPAAPPPTAHKRNPVVATATGVGIGAVALACFYGGAASTLALVAVVLTLAAGEAFATLRRAGRRPLTLLGLAAVPMAAVGAYLWGARVLPDVLAASLIIAIVATLARGRRSAPVRDLGATFFVITWVGVPGVFAALLISPAHFPDRHGVAFCFAAVAVTVAHDVGSYAVGSRLGKHPLAARVSPNKTVEGLIGGTVAAVVVALAGTSFIHPISMLAAGLLALVVAVLAPLGDLAESLVKRDTGVKDMGRLLPAHGGVFDRVDALLFVLPAAYGLFTALALR